MWRAFIAERLAHDAADVAADFKPGFPCRTGRRTGASRIPCAFADGVANVVASPDIGADTITYDATAYAVQRRVPRGVSFRTLRVFTQPTQLNVTVALAYASPNNDTIAKGTFNLNFNGPDPRAYFPSTYSYMLAQTSGFDPGKGATLGKFLCYAVSEGQTDAIPLEYARLSSQIERIAINAIVQIPGRPRRRTARSQAHRLRLPR